MPRMREAMRSGSNGSRASVFSPDAQEHDRLAGDLPHRQRRAAARIAVRLGEDDAGQIERGTEGARGVDRVLAGHGIDHEQPLGGADGGVDVAHLRHQLLVDVQPAGGVDDQHVEHAAPGALERRARDGRRGRAARGRERTRRRPAPASRSSCSIAAGRRTSVLTSSTRFLSRSMQPARQLGRGRGLAGALQAREQHAPSAAARAG